jgi:glycosyltransferase involved in cell wall biosynthesis
MALPRPRRILISTSTFPRNGHDASTARFVLDLATHLSAQREVVVLAPSAPGAPDRERWGDVEVRRYRYFAPARLQRLTAGAGVMSEAGRGLVPGAQVPLLVAAQWAALPRVAREEQVDLVNAHWIVPQGLVGAAWRRRLRVPLVVSAHGTDVRLLSRAPGGAAVARFTLGRADRLLAASRHLAAEAERLAGRALPHEVVPMGVDLGRFAPDGERVELAAPGEAVILFVGKLLATKGVHVLLDALARLSGDGVRARLVVVGDGPERAALAASAGARGLADRVAFRGWMPQADLPPLYRSADVVCVPSTRDARGETEGTPVVLLEALASGAPVVASRMSGIPDVLADGGSGWLVPPGDAAALAGALRAALRLGKDGRAALAASARAAASAHRWDRVAGRYLEAFDEAAARAAEGARHGR